MKLDANETELYQIKPDQKILVMWFFKKTLTYALSSLIFAFTLLFIINTADVLNKEPKKSSENIEMTTTDNEETVKQDLEHPFQLMVKYWGWALLVAILTTVLAQVYLIYLRKSYLYIVTDQRCVFVGGILKRIERSVSYKKVTDVQRTQNIFERILGIWNVQLFTPGTGSMAFGQRQPVAEINFDGLINSEEVMEAINKCVQSNTQ